MKTFLVTGGAGFIGSHVCEALLQKGYNVVSLDSFNDFYNTEYKKNNILEVENNSINSTFTSLDGDICDKEFLIDLFENNIIDSVIHLAAYAGVRPSIQDPTLYANVNINGTVNLLECVKEYGIKKFIFASSSSVYGNNEKVPFSESDFVDNPISPYAATKKAGELICHTYHHLYNINMACLRFFTVYGPRQRPDLAIYKFTDLILSGKPIPFFGDGTTQRDYTNIDDIVDGILKSLSWVDSKEKLFDVFNLGESNTITLAQMVQTIEKALGIKAELDKMPKQPGDVEKTFADISKAKSILGYNPSTEFETGIENFVKWFKANRT